MARINRGPPLYLLLAVFLCSACGSLFFVEEKGPITSERAGKYIGKTKTVCGMVASSFYDQKNAGQPTFLNLDRPFPDHYFTVVIWGLERPKFSEPPEKTFQGKRVCATGEITTHDGKPQIAVHEPSQITIESD